MNNRRLINARGVAGFNTIIPTSGQTATAPGIALGIPSGQQAALGSLSQADSPLRIEPYRLTPGPWWCCVDTSTGRSFGGRYTAREVDYIAAAFRDWPPRPIETAEFGRVAERAIRQAQGFCHIPSDKSDRWVGGAA